MFTKSHNCFFPHPIHTLPTSLFMNHVQYTSGSTKWFHEAPSPAVFSILLSLPPSYVHICPPAPHPQTPSTCDTPAAVSSLIPQTMKFGSTFLRVKGRVWANKKGFWGRSLCLQYGRTPNQYTSSISIGGITLLAACDKQRAPLKSARYMWPVACDQYTVPLKSAHVPLRILESDFEFSSTFQYNL